jgi:beta-fructofuranosidase
MSFRSNLTRREFLKLGGIATVGLATNISPWKVIASPLTPWETRQKMAADPLRPLYHFLPPSNWMNDPNGVIQWKGQYHLFYQYNPDDPVWGNIHWGHAVSDNLVHWRDLPIALEPTPGDPDQNGCWSGSAVNDNGTPTILYTGATYTVPIERYRGGPDARQVVCLATSNDNLVTWQKYAHNPVITPPLGLVEEGFRDPYVWRENNQWYTVIGSGIIGQGAAVLLYRSPDLREWKYLGPLFTGDAGKYGMMFECPSFFTLGDKHVLVVGARGKPRYFVGTYSDHNFTPETTGVLDAGIYYSPQVMVDEQGRRILFGWVWEGGWTWPGRNNEALKVPGWAGVSSLPRILSLAPDNTLFSRPVPELTVLRAEHVHLSDIELKSGSDQVLPIKGNCLEILAEFEVANTKGCGLKLCCSQDGKEKTVVAYNRKDHKLIVSLLPASRLKHSRVETARLQLVESETLKLHIFLDRSIVEVFANDRCCITSRFYPSSDSHGINLFANGDGGRLKSLDIWQMKPIWPRNL